MSVGGRFGWQHTHQLTAQPDGLEVSLPLGLDESLFCQALALEALLAVGRRLHPLRDDISGHFTLGPPLGRPAPPI
jgi:hypothetical protein